MTPRLKSTRAARDLIKTHEPFLAEAERRGKRWVVGYGHTAAAKEGVSLKPEDAELLLIYDVMRAEQTIDANVGAEMAAPMRDALVSFALSVGLRAFKVSDVARLARAGRHRDAAAAIETWVRADIDGRLTVSDRLVTRRAAEKALYLTGLEDSAATLEAQAVAQEPEPAPETDVEAVADDAADEADAQLSEDEPEQSELEAEPQAEPAVEAEPEPESESEAEDYTASETSEPAALIELDIAFETPEMAETESAAVSESDNGEEELTADSEQTVTESETEIEDAAEEAEVSDDDTDSEFEPVEPVAEVDAEAEAEPEPEPETSQADLDAVKAAQDASIAAVMARMAQQVSASVAPSASDDARVKLGYSFLSTAHVDIGVQDEPSEAPAPVEPTIAPEPVETATAPEPARPKSLFSSPAVPMGPFHGALQVSSIKMTPIAPEALPQGSEFEEAEDESIQTVAELSDADDAVSVEIPSVEDAEPDVLTASHEAPSDPAVFSAPPHPALAPASAPGMSGDIEGPDHPDKDDDEPQHDLHEDGEELDPALVAGSEAPVVTDGEPAQSKGGDVMFISSLAVGGAMVGLGGWDIAANMDAYMELGLSYSPLGPIVFSAGVLLSAASAWFIIGRRNEK